MFRGPSDDYAQDGGASNSDYSSRSYNLSAGQVVPLPPGTEFIIFSASGNLDAVEISVGDSNGDFSPWPTGIAIRFPVPVKTRMRSLVAQVVTVLIASGGITLNDNRPPIYPTAGVNSLRTGGIVGTGGNVLFINANQNLNGVVIYQIIANIRGLAVGGGEVVILSPFDTIWSMAVPDVGGIVGYTLPNPISIQAGVNVSYAAAAGVAYSMHIYWKAL